ncbi:hypothetical protein ACFY5F_23645 [Streptomyces sp. NPDC013161]
MPVGVWGDGRLTTDQLAALAAAVGSGESPSEAALTWLRSKELLS